MQQTWRIPEWEEACRKYSKNYILEEKYTQLSYINDVESLVFGSYISGYSGYYGIRYDDSGWSDSTWDGVDGENVTKEQYRVATGLPIHFERLAFNGLTVIDGPELVWNDDFKETNPKTDSEGYKVRNWEMFDQFQNDMIDMFRKVLDGTVRISSRQEVIDRTKVAVIQDVTTSDNYNPNKDGKTAGGYFIPKYNTCRQVEVSYSEYGTGIIKEFSDHMDIYCYPEVILASSKKVPPAFFRKDLIKFVLFLFNRLPTRRNL